MTRYHVILCLGAYISTASHAQTSGDCGSIENAYGPFDYTNAAHFNEMLPRVEMAHFDLGVEQLVGHAGKGNGFAMLGGDIDYTLRAFPNHHRALVTMSRYYLTKVPQGSAKLRYSAECYFDRALRIAPNDATVRMIEGMYYYKLGDLARAQQSYETALQLSPQSAEVNYNVALLYLDLGSHELALKHARMAYDFGFPLPGLRRKLQRLGIWKDD